MLDSPVLVLPIAGVRLVLDAMRVGAIEDAARADGARRDLASMMGLEVAPGRRRALRVASDGSWLIAGERVIVRSLRREAFKPLPPWLAALGERLGLSGLVDVDGGFAFALDFDRIVREPSRGASI